MRSERMERFTVLPFSMGCVSHSSVAIVQTRTPTSKPPPSSGVERGTDPPGTTKSAVLGGGRPSISAGLQRVAKGFKSLPQLFSVYEEDDEEMEIGVPTDVQHLAHIGVDGLTSVATLSLVQVGFGEPPMAQV